MWVSFTRGERLSGEVSVKIVQCGRGATVSNRVNQVDEYEITPLLQTVL